MGPQEHAFRSGVDVIVATPGRLLDHFRFPYARLEHLEILVLDEADRMLDMGFLPDIRRVLKHLPPRRQTLFFSATMPPPIAQLTREMLKNPVTVNLERKAAPAVGITQAVYPVPQDLKAPLLLELLKRGDIKNVLVFTRTKHRANRLAENLARHGIGCERIHGNRTQAQRTEALAGFKDGRFRVLVATDIAARGIDVEALSHVVNFDVPNVPEDYIHRVGRTARAEMTGDAFTFVSPEEDHGPRRDRARDRQAPAARHGAGLRLREGSGRALRGSDRRADRRDPRPQGRRAQASPGEGRAARGPRSRAESPRGAEASASARAAAARTATRACRPAGAPPRRRRDSLRPPEPVEVGVFVAAGRGNRSYLPAAP